MTNGTLEFLRFCSEPTEAERNLAYELDNGYSWINTQNKSHCDTEFNALKEELRSFTANPQDQSFLLPILDKYEKNVVNIYVNGTNNHSSVMEHQQCLQLREDFLDLSNRLHRLFDLNVEVRETDNITEALVHVEQIIEINKKLSSFPSLQTYYTKITKKCNWLYHYDTTRDDALLATLVAGYEGAIDHLSRAAQQFDAMKEPYNNLRLHVEDTVVPMTELVKAYMDRNVTKKILGKEMVKAYTPEVREAMMVPIDDLKRLLMAYMTEINLGKSMMEDMYINLARLELSFITKENVDELELVKSTSEINDALLDEIIDTLKDNMVEDLQNLLNEIFVRLTSPTDDLKWSVVKTMDGIVEKFDALKMDLQAYIKSMDMNADFYM